MKILIDLSYSRNILKLILKPSESSDKSLNERFKGNCEFIKKSELSSLTTIKMISGNTNKQ